MLDILEIFGKFFFLVLNVNVGLIKKFIKNIVKLGSVKNVYL